MVLLLGTAEVLVEHAAQLISQKQFPAAELVRLTPKLSKQSAAH